MSVEPRSAALDEWVIATAPRAVAYATSLLRDRDAAEDVVQDCFCRLLARSAVYDLPRDGLKLLMRSVTNACINRRSRHRPMFRLYRTDAAGESDTDDHPADRTARPDQLAAAGELETAIAAGLDRLPAKQRAALELKSFGHSQNEVAEILGTTPGHAGVLIHRARQAMARHLAPYLGDDTQS